MHLSQAFKHTSIIISAFVTDSCCGEDKLEKRLMMHLMDRDLYSPFKGVNRGGLVGKRMGNMAILISESTESACLKLSLVSGLL